MKKICFLMPTVFNLGGEQRVVSCLSSILSKNGYEVTLLLFNNRYKEDYSIYNLDKNVSVKYVDNYFTFFHKLSRKVRNLNSKYGFFKYFRFLQILFFKWSFPYHDVKKELKKINPDVIVGVSGDYAMLCSLLKKELNLKTIGWQHSCHDAYFNMKGNRHFNEKKAFNFLIKNGIDQYIVLTKTDKEKFEKEFSISPIQIYNMKSFTTNQRANLKAKQIIAAGRLVSLKGFDLLIEAFNLFQVKCPDWTLKIVGEGEEKENLNKLIEKLNLSDKVILTGYCNDMQKMYCESSIYVLSSKWEGFPMVLTECMEVGLPMISFDIDVMKEFIANGIDGILVPKFDVNKLASSLENLASDFELRSKISKNCLKKIEMLSENNILDEWKKVLEELN